MYIHAVCFKILDFYGLDAEGGKIFAVKERISPFVIQSHMPT
jgi:hypothetical protein